MAHNGDTATATSSGGAATTQPSRRRQQRFTSVLELDKIWHHVALPLRACSLKDIAMTVADKAQMDACFREAQAVLDAESTHAQLDRGRWYSAQFLARGTTADKIASAAVKLADTDFMFFLDAFGQLFDTARADAHHYEAALKALTAVWPKLLPPRPLRRFTAQYFATLPGGCASVSEDKTDGGTTATTATTATDAKEDDNDKSGSSKKHDDDDADAARTLLARRKVLVYWYVEDYLKRTYAQFLALCETMLKDRVVQRRAAWLEATGRVMCAVAESRHVAMALVIDKLGDSEARIAHSAYHLLLRLLSESSTHQGVLFTELEKVIFTRNCPLRTMRYAANVLNQLVFSKDERKLAVRGVLTYLTLFRQLAVSGHVDTSVTTAILIGLRRAFPYAGTDLSLLSDHIKALFVLANTGNFQQRVATLSLLQLLVHHKGADEAFRSRWYRALYNLLLLSPKHMPQSAQLTGFFAMLHKAVRADTNDERVVAFVHRLLQRALFFSDAMTCATLLLVGELAQTRPAVRRVLRGHARDVHATATTAATTADATGDTAKTRYDVKAREPQFARASRECAWVLNILARHAHPSVVKLAVLLLFGDEMVFDVHPLDDMTFANFLQVFVDAKPHTSKGASGATAAAALRHGDAAADDEDDDDDKDTTAAAATAAAARASNVGGVAVFRRAVHTAHLPSASDAHFVHTRAQDVDVALLFLHRYAVQRERFLRGLQQTRSTWGDASGEGEVAERVADVDGALFGPRGRLAPQPHDASDEDDDDVTAAAAAEEAEEAVTATRQKKKTKSSKKATASAMVTDEDDEEDEDDDMDAVADDDDLRWGSEDEAVYDATLLSEDDNEDDLDDEEEDDDEDDDGLVSRVRDVTADDGGDFGELIAQHQHDDTARKRQREEAWLAQRSLPTTPHTARGRGRAAAATMHSHRGRGGRGGGRGGGRARRR